MNTTAITHRTGRKSKCIHCARQIVETRNTPDEYIEVYGVDTEVWVDVKEQRALCMIDNYSTAHITAKEWASAQ